MKVTLIHPSISYKYACGTWDDCSCRIENRYTHVYKKVTPRMSINIEDTHQDKLKSDYASIKCYVRLCITKRTPVHIKKSMTMSW